MGKLETNLFVDLQLNVFSQFIQQFDCRYSWWAISILSSTVVDWGHGNWSEMSRCIQSGDSSLR